MALIGIDIGNNNCKIAMRDGGSMKLISSRMPDNIVRDGEVASPETMARFLKMIRADERIRDRNCALVLSSNQVFFRHISLPLMSTAELELNLPYEFRDFISDDPEGYLYDYAVDEIIPDEDGGPSRMELYASAVSKQLVDEYAMMLKKSGFKLRMVTPAPMAYARLLQDYAKRVPEFMGQDVVLVDIGHADVTVSLFRGLRYDSARTIEMGCHEFDNIIADLKGIDPYTAGSYKFTNFEHVLDDPACLALCDRFAVEVAKVINFYNFSNREREISLLCFLGGGARIPQLTMAIAEAVAVPAASIEAVLPPEARGQENSPVCALAIGSMLEGEAM